MTRLTAALAAALLLVSGQAYAQKISQFPTLSGNAAGLNDAFLAQSTSCAGGNCRETLGQILGALASNNLVTSPATTDTLVMTPSGATPRVVTIATLLALVPGTTGVLKAANNLSDLASAATARTNLGLSTMATMSPASVALTGGTISGVTGSFTSVYTTSLSLGNTAVNATNTYSGEFAGDTFQLQGSISPSASAATIYQDALGCYSASCVNADAVRGVMTANAGTSVINVNGVAGYVLNNNAGTGSGQNSVALFGVGVSAVNGAATWGINTLLTDNTSQAASSGTGRGLYNEFDFNITSSSTKANGLAISGTFLNPPSTQTNGFVLTSATAGRHWQNGFASSNDSANTAFLAGTAAAATNANIASQTVSFVSTDSSAAQHVESLYSVQGGVLVSTGPVMVPGYYVSGLPSCTAAINGALASVIDANGPSYGAGVSGGGSSHTLVMCNGQGTWIAQ